MLASFDKISDAACLSLFVSGCSEVSELTMLFISAFILVVSASGDCLSVDLPSLTGIVLLPPGEQASKATRQPITKLYLTCFMSENFLMTKFHWVLFALTCFGQVWE